MNVIEWSSKIPFLKNTFLLRSIFMAYLVVILITTFIISVIFIADGDAAHLADIALPLIGVYLLVLVLFAVSTWIVIGEKYVLDYKIDDEGILVAGKHDKARNIRKLAIAAGIITGKPGVVGAGMLVKDNVIFIPWTNISSLKLDSEKQRIVVKSSFWKQVALHYPKEIEGKVIEMLDVHSIKI